MFERFRVTRKADGGGGAGFNAQEQGVVGIVAVHLAVHLPRDPETLEHVDVPGLYPCGEGAGYAGGIVSSALDGINCAEKL